MVMNKCGDAKAALYRSHISQHPRSCDKIIDGNILLNRLWWLESTCAFNRFNLSEAVIRNAKAHDYTDKVKHWEIHSGSLNIPEFIGSISGARKSFKASTTIYALTYTIVRLGISGKSSNLNGNLSVLFMDASDRFFVWVNLLILFQLFIASIFTCILNMISLALL